ncbi:MAG: sigma-70 family RNA polymerase sigma factor [Cytophagales bacterium]|nr:MAG: sigma-70 family RNA polymerase sigma factor [Cytophagales bacterium]
MKDQEVIEKIRKGDETALDYIYTKNFRTITKMIINQRGSKDEAKDIYQEAVIVFWQNAIKPEFTLTAKISTYIYSIAKNLWHKELNRKMRLTNQEDIEDNKELLAEDINVGDKEKLHIIQKCINSLGETCKKVLTYYYFDGFNMQDIAKLMNFANADTAKTKKYKCKKELDNLIKKTYKATDFLD